MDFFSLKSISNATVFLQVICIPEMFLEKALKGQRSNLVARKRKKKVRWGEGNKDERAEQY